jgi:outer membrane protein assembly factor BamD (BamD/ComL family)
VARSDVATALDALDSYDRTFPSGTLAPEAAVLRVQALLARGDRAAAIALTDAFLRAHPASPYAAKMRALVGNNP